jgi:5-methylthioadenosine/S-adenosylhomocysteine deaminase
MRLVSADWLLPVSRPPLRDGAVLVESDRIVAVGPRAELAGRYPDAVSEHFADCIATPGLVNAHTHLTLTALAGVVPPLPFAEWLPRLVAALKPWEVADHEASGVVGAEECLLSGVTVVGDIAYGAAEVASASGAGLGGVYYWELLGMRPGEIAQALADLRYPTAPDAYGPRVTCGLSPHSPYTAGPELLQAVHAEAARLGVPLAIHVSESQAEVDLLRDGGGPLAPTAARTAIDFAPPHASTTEYLDRLGALTDVTAVHLCFATAEDVETLAGTARGGVTCPRSNRYLSNPVPLVAPMLATGLALGVGTDSSASNHDLDLLAEVREILRAEPELPAAKLLELATATGARAIGVEDRFGALEPGLQADLAIFALQSAENPERELLERGGRQSVRAVMSGGEWRVREGGLLRRDPAAARRAASAREASLRHLGSL